MNIKALAIAAIMALTAPLGAKAVTLDLAGLGPGSLGSTISLDFGGVVDGVTISAVSNGSAGNISTGQDSIGVAGSPQASFMGAGEELQFSFDDFLIASSLTSLRVTLLTLVERGDDDQDFFYGVNGDQDLGSIPGTPGKIQTFALSTVVNLGDTFSIYGFYDDPDVLGIRLAALEATTVPLPAPFLLLLSGVAGLGFVARRRALAAA
ncbi:hypothetical protein KHP62_20235 [Rhodobacteraceae bacterium NNCM2]|nr:hypothetical protein [Coraliihabitans acroporae]